MTNKNKSTSKRVCIMCGKDHTDELVPVSCQAKSAVASALIDTLGTPDAVFLMDKTDFLKRVEDNLREKDIIK